MSEEINNETLDLSRRGLKKIEKAPPEESTTIINLILDHNDLQRLDNIDTYIRVESLSICNNFLLRMHGVSRLKNIRVLCLNNNGILQIEGLKEMTYLKVLKLAGNSIKTIEHLNNNIHLEHLDLSHNQISFIADISYLKSLKQLSLERNRIMDLRQCDRYLPAHLAHLALAHNNVHDLNELSHLAHLTKLESFTFQGNPCVSPGGKEKLNFDYRPFILNWILSVKSIDGYNVSAIESLKAEWLYSQGKGRHYTPGQHEALCEYLATTCPVGTEARNSQQHNKLTLILNKAQHHQQQLKEASHSPVKSKLQSPRMQSRIASRHSTRSPDRMSASYHGGVRSPCPPAHGMHASCHEDLQRGRDSHEPPPKPHNQSLEAASKMVPVPESLMSPDYQEPLYDLHRSIAKPTNNSTNSSVTEERVSRHIVQPSNVNRNMRGSPKLTKSATSSPRLKSKLDQRKGSLTKLDTKDKHDSERKTSINGKINGENAKVEVIKQNETDSKASNVRKGKKMSSECMAAVTIQKMWRGYRSRNLNRDSMRIIHAIQAARARQHIQRLSCDMEATKAALDSERKIQQLQMQAISALWKKVSSLQDTQKPKPLESEDSTAVLKHLVETCDSLKSQMSSLQSCVQLIASSARLDHATVATQTDATVLDTTAEDRWLRRPQSLPITTPSVPAAVQIVETPLVNKDIMAMIKEVEVETKPEVEELKPDVENIEPKIETENSQISEERNVIAEELESEKEREIDVE